ncbi:MAG: hypothetical protein HQL61_14315 [Magnetococcales bacterium]|nr:hypothetical protein [Nitrospirota bacterium]
MLVLIMMRAVRDTWVTKYGKNVSSLFFMVKERRRAAPPPPQTSPARGPAPLTPFYHAFFRGYEKTLSMLMLI